jgi:hypothetical protein
MVSVGETCEADIVSRESTQISLKALDSIAPTMTFFPWLLKMVYDIFLSLMM